MKLSFHLSRSSDKLTQIMCYVSYQGHRKISLKTTVIPKYWDKKRQRLKLSRETPEAVDVNLFLDSLYSKMVSYESQLKIEGKDISLDILIEKLRELIQPKAADQDNRFLAFFAKVIQDKIDDPNFARGSIKYYKTAIRQVREYIGNDIPFSSLDILFWKNFVNHLYSCKYKPNYVAKTISTCRTVVKLANEKGIDVDRSAFQSNLLARIGVSKSNDVTKVYLNKAELKQLEQVELNERLGAIRDSFLVGCYTGLRYSDLAKLNQSNIQGSVIKITTAKTGETVIIPIHTVVRRIVDHYGGFPPSISNQKTNENLKTIMEIAGFDSDVIVTEYRGGKNKRTDIVKKKYELITTHTARRSFATNMYLSGDVPVHSIMKITGHRTERSFLTYIVLENREHTDIVGMSKFFTE